VKILLGYQSYESDSPSAIGQRLLNLYAEKDPDIVGMTASSHRGMQFMIGSKFPWTLYSTPGQKLWLDLLTGSTIQGMQVMGDFLYVVSNNTVYKVSTIGAITTIGTISGAQNIVSMANNGLQMTIVAADNTAYVTSPHSNALWADGTVALWSDGTIASWAGGPDSLINITGYTNFSPASSVCYLESYNIFSVADSIQFFISDNYNATVYPGSFASTIATPSNIVLVYSFGGALWIFTANSYEVWQNTGAADFPFQLIANSANTTRGLAAKFSVAQDANTMFMLADDLIVYSFSEYTPQRISHHGVESAIQRYKDTVGISDAIGFTYTQRGHKFYCLTFPSAGETWCYDIAQSLWHQRSTYGAGRWSPNALVEFAGKTLVGDYKNGKIYELDLNTYTDDTQPITRLAQGAVTWEDGLRINHDLVRLDADMGLGLTTGQGQDPQVVMQYSDDGGNTYSNERWASLGKVGEYRNQAVWKRNGQSRQRIYRFTITDPVPVRINGAYADVRVGRR
jgi:hypothetical protein